MQGEGGGLGGEGHQSLQMQIFQILIPIMHCLITHPQEVVSINVLPYDIQFKSFSCCNWCSHVPISVAKAPKKSSQLNATSFIVIHVSKILDNIPKKSQKFVACDVPRKSTQDLISKGSKVIPIHY